MRTLTTFLSLSLLASAPLLAADRFTNIAAAADPTYFGFLHRFAIATNDGAGNDRVIGRYGYETPAFGFDIGDRLGSDIIIDGTGIWGSDGTLMDVEISSIVKPEAVLVLLDTLEIVEMRGIWGSSGTLHPSEVIVHGPFWDRGACGGATAMVELLREVAEPDGVQPDPLLAIGTEGGCVGFVGYETPAFGFEWFENASDWADLPLTATGDPLIGIWGSDGTLHPVDDLALLKVDDDWNVIPAEWEAPTDDWVAPTGDWIPNPKTWIPSPKNWIPNPKNWFEVGAVSGGRVHAVFPGRRAIGDTPGFPPFSTFELAESVDGEQLTALAGPRIPLGTMPSIAIDDPGTVLIESPLAGNSVEAAVRVSNVNIDSVAWGETRLFTEETLTPLAAPLERIALGSLVGITQGGQSIVFLPQYNAGSGEPGPQAMLGGVSSVDLGPRAFNLGAKGRFVTAAIESAEDGSDQIIPDSIALHIEGDPGDPVAPLQIKSADKDGDGNGEWVAKFDRGEIHARLAPFGIGAQILLTLAWDYVDQCDLDTPCTGSYAQAVTLVNE